MIRVSRLLTRKPVLVRMWCSEFRACAMLICLLCFSIVVKGGAGSLSRITRQSSGIRPVSYECLTTNNIGGTCVHYSQCPEHSAKPIEELRLHRCFRYRKTDQPPIVCCASPSERPATLQVGDAIPQSSSTSVQLGDVTTPASMRPRDRFSPDNDDLLHHPHARLLPTQSCGIHFNGSMFTGRTYGSNTTQLGGFPWTVLLKYQKGNKEKFLCGGVLIGDRYVLTAAHCVLMDDAQLVAVRIGEHDISTDPDCGNSEENVHSFCAPLVRDIPVMRTVTPVEYGKSDRNHYHDIALVILRNTTQFNDYVQPICLPFGEMGSRDLTNRRLWIAGWGTRAGKDIRVKLAADVRVRNHADCVAEYQEGHITISRDKHICAVDRDSCKSDSGGPLMNFRGTPRGDIWYLHGISSFGPTPCTIPGMSEVYTRVSYYLSWILRSLSAGSK